MPSGTMSTITMAPPGVFAASMPPELSSSASPVPSSEDRESVSSTEGRRGRLAGVANGVTSIGGSGSQTLSSSYCSSPKFVIDSSKSSSNEPFGKIRKKARSHRNRGGGGQHCSPYSVNKPLKVTIRRTNAHSHTLDSNMQDGVSRLSPSSVYSSVPGDDEKSPILVISPHTIPNSNKAVDYSGGTRDIAVSTLDEATSVEPDQLGPCEPGTKINLSGSVWIETPGMMVVNMSWRGRSYVGALMDVSKNGVNVACPSKMITSISNLKNKINWSYASLSTGTSASAGNSTGPIRTRSSIGGGLEATTTVRGRPLVSARGRRRRRGNGLPTSSSATALASDGMESNQDEQDEVPSSSNPLPRPELDAPVECPFSACGRRFADMRCLYGHLDHSHRPSKKSKVEAKGDQAARMSELREVASPAAPQLAKAISSAGAEEGSLGVENSDEDPPPPKLDRGPTIDDVPGPSMSATVNEQPPKASPAYSDISDGPTVENGPPWKSPAMVPPPTLQQQSQQPQSQPLDWSIGSRRSVTNPTASHPSVPIRNPYDFDPAVVSEAAVQSRMAQFAYPPALHPSAGASYNPQQSPGSPFNFSRNPMGGFPQLPPAQLANFLFQRSQPDFTATGTLQQHMLQQQQQVRSPRQRQSPHNILPPGMGSHFRPPL